LIMLITLFFWNTLVCIVGSISGDRLGARPNLAIHTLDHHLLQSRSDIY
jgi:hypothetical protein